MYQSLYVLFGYKTDDAFLSPYPRRRRMQGNWEFDVFGVQGATKKE